MDRVLGGESPVSLALSLFFALSLIKRNSYTLGKGFREGKKKRKKAGGYCTVERKRGEMAKIARVSDKLTESGSRQLSTTPRQDTEFRSTSASSPVFSVLIRTVECRTSRHAANAEELHGSGVQSLLRLVMLTWRRVHPSCGGSFFFSFGASRDGSLQQGATREMTSLAT